MKSSSVRHLEAIVSQFVVLLAVLVSFSSVSAQERAKPVAQPAASPAAKDQKAPANPQVTGTIKGQVVASDGQPLTNASVMIQAFTGIPAAKPTRVDAQGRFSFDDLLPGSYAIVASAPGYIDESTASRDFTQWPRHLIGSNVRVNMIRGGVITGQVTNAKGEPLVGIPVRATVVSQTPSSVLSFVTGGNSAETDDRGIYRMYGLMPGQYVVETGGTGRFGALAFAANGFDNDVPTFYPAATRDTAVAVAVRSGDETAGIDIKYRGADGHTISGAVLGDVPSQEQSVITILLAHSSSNAVLALKIVLPQDVRRSFSFNGVADGEYDLFASYLSDPKANALISTKHVTVRGGDLTGLELRLAALASIAGTIALEPIKPEDKCDKRNSQLVETFLSIPRDQPSKSGRSVMLGMLGGGLSTLNEKGEFALRNLEAGKYRFDIRLPSESWYVRAIKVPSTPAQTTVAGASLQTTNTNAATGWQGFVTLKAGEQISGSSVLVGQDAAGLRGRLLTEGAIRENTTVHLVPVDREQANDVLRYSEAMVKSDGSFALKNLAPGRYFILARVEAAVENEASRIPVSFDAPARTKLRREAETTNLIVELKPCQKVIDYELKGNF